MEPVTPDMTIVPAPKNNRTLIIGVVVAVVLCCCCLVVGLGGWYLWNNGDQLLGVSSLAPVLLAL